MRELVRTNDPVLLNYLENLLQQAGITALIADSNMSILEGSIGMLPRRLLVHEDNAEEARKLIKEVDLGKWLYDEGS